MEKSASKKQILRDTKEKIITGFIQHMLEHGKEPVSVYKFTQSIQIKEEEFYQYFTSFKSIKSAVWDQLFDHSVKNLEAEEIYKSYSAREKMLGFFFTWIEELKKNRSYLLTLYTNQFGRRGMPPVEIKSFKEKFKSFVSDIILEGKETEEIANRPYISDKYDEALWLQLMFVLQFWIKDDSPGFEKTDAAIEKSVNLAFDLMGKSALDSFVDFAKFMYQSK
ncbi:TetR/AcrR family transcriptional regulator [Pararhodonellum marinum]|uniref:TetR/AcrR family transcriptional regulator n=1 Tax=Pararhodonellum marinum TaxID=2755358 RepID=UPI00188FB279|nr:TetR family transcriptional regulator C-terminal domain-containing protein [Pararhodonellum marinum]